MREDHRPLFSASAPFCPGIILGFACKAADQVAPLKGSDRFLTEDEVTNKPYTHLPVPETRDSRPLLGFYGVFQQEAPGYDGRYDFITQKVTQTCLNPLQGKITALLSLVAGGSPH